jgi:hypothetical protein
MCSGMVNSWRLDPIQKFSLSLSASTSGSELAGHDSQLTASGVPSLSRARDCAEQGPRWSSGEVRSRLSSMGLGQHRRCSKRFDEVLEVEYVPRSMVYMLTH